MANYNVQPERYHGNQHGYSPFKNYKSQIDSGYSASQRKKDFTKHSGAKHTTYTPVTGNNAGVEQHLTTGWRLSKGELIAIKCVTTSKSNLSEKGWFGSVAVTFTNTKTGVQQFHWGTMQKSSGKVVIDSMAVVINPRAKNGGYAGTFLRSK